MENNNDPGFEIDRIHDQEKDRRAEESAAREIKQVSSAQQVLISKILRSGKILDQEFQQLEEIREKQVVTTYDAAIFIEYVLATLKFRRTFLNGKHKAYKKCYYCKSRDNIERYLHLETGRKLWVCENCAINLDNSKFVQTKFAEQKEASADLYRKYEFQELTPAQEDLICEHKER